MNDNGFNFHSQGFRSFDDIFKDFDFGSGNGHGKEWKFSFGGGGGGFDDFFDDDDEEEDDDFFGGFKFGGFGDSFFSDGSFHTTSHREDVFTNDDGERMHRNVRHTAFRESSKCGCKGMLLQPYHDKILDYSGIALLKRNIFFLFSEQQSIFCVV